MAYTKTVWKTGDVITAAKLNNAEDGIEAAQGVLISGVWSEVSSEQWCTFDSTFTEIKAYLDNGIVPVFLVPGMDEQQADHYYLPIECIFTGTKSIVLDTQGTVTLHDEGSDDVPVFVVS